MSAQRVKGIDLAARLDVKPQTITGWRNGQYLPDQSKWPALCDALQLDLDDLFGPAELINQDPHILVEDCARPYPYNPSPVAHRRPMIGLESEYSKPDPHERLTRAELQAEIDYYLDCAERAGAIEVAAYHVRKYLDPAQFKVMAKKLKPPTEPPTE
jgi:transcriptional regulator with XRE-family HTH domain